MNPSQREMIRKWLDKDPVALQDARIVGVPKRYVCKSRKIVDHVWYSGKFTLPDGRRYRLAWSITYDGAVVGGRIN